MASDNSAAASPVNLYVHFPFCRSRCSYCALYSRAARSVEERNAYARRIAEAIPRLNMARPLKTVYFGGGSPALCDLRPVLDALAPCLGRCAGCSESTEFTVELHPFDVTFDLLATLKDGGINRISMGVQSLDDRILAHMGRGYTFADAECAFGKIKKVFGNAGIDLIVGYPGETGAILPQHERLADWGLCHCSVYALQNERMLKNVVDDETLMNRLANTAEFMQSIGLERYEISNYAVPGFECRHNVAVWRGEDYIGLGDGACGRIGRYRTRNFWGQELLEELASAVEIVDEKFDEKERCLFRLRTREGLDATRHPEWQEALSRFVAEGLLVRREKTGMSEVGIYCLTARGAEICDSILSELV